MENLVRLEDQPDIPFPRGHISAMRMHQLCLKAKRTFHNLSEFRGAAKLILAGLPLDERVELETWAKRRSGSTQTDYGYWIVLALYDAALLDNTNSKVRTDVKVSVCFEQMFSRKSARGMLLPLV